MADPEEPLLEAPEAPAKPMEVPIYRTLEPCFIEPEFIKADKLIEYDGEPGPHLQPVNESARLMMEAYYKAKPEASINPTEALPMTEGAAAIPTARVVGDTPADPVMSFVDVAHQAGYTRERAKVTSLGEAKAGGARVIG